MADTTPKTTHNTVLARLACDEPTARHIAALTAECFTDAVAGAFEGDGQWTVEIHFREPPDQEALRALIASAAGKAAARALALETVAERDWLAASLAGLTPVMAGRFAVHGAHHRSQIPPNAIGIEIEAALAFGTGHH